mmetsp:Transcript_16468/g.47011  ORF Transcript_16468/g.47011 Transcript_16468/m.47011 type:complete len:351 (+) Transcript_16468:312-1364(+)
MKPSRVERPVTLPPCSKASGRTVFAIMHSIAPPQRPSMEAITLTTVGSSWLPGGKMMAPKQAPKPVITVMEAHIIKMTPRRMPCSRIVPAEDIASGKLARKTPTTKARRVPWDAVFTRIPMTKLSGTPSMRMPSQIMIAACTPLPPSCPWPSLPSAAAVAAFSLARRSGRSLSAARSTSLPPSRPPSSSPSRCRSCASSSVKGSEAVAAPPPAPASSASFPSCEAAAEVCLCHPRSSSAAQPKREGPTVPSGGSSGTGTHVSAAAASPTDKPGALATSACRKRSSFSQSLSMSLRCTISTVVRSRAVAVAGAAWPSTRCSVPSSPFACTVCRVAPSWLPRTTSTHPSTTK